MSRSSLIRNNLVPGCMFANCGSARCNGLRMRKAIGVRMAMVHVNGAEKCASELIR